MTSRELRVLLLEDDPPDAALVESALSRAGFDVEVVCVDTQQAYEFQLRTSEPDFVLSDHSLAQFGAGEALETLNRTCPHVPFVVVSGATDAAAAVDLVSKGADDYVSKDQLDRLPAVVSKSLELRSDLRGLSPRQLEVLRLVAMGKTNREIAEEWGISVKTVESHRTALMKRLDIHDVARLVRYAIRVKLVRP